MTKCAPSILSADFSRLGEEVERLEACGADWVHIDVMDGHFVPSITIGPAVIKAIRPRCRLPFDVHLMVQEPGRFIEDFAQAGADIITVHIEAAKDLALTLRRIKGLGKKVGLSLNPPTPFAAVVPYMDKIDLLLVMTVNPGFAGQKFIADCLPKIKEAREYVDARSLSVEIEVDGGINLTTAKQAVEAGATVLAAGSALFCAADMRREIEDWRRL
jgi:ribulose-phosphate 3-epimerase